MEKISNDYTQSNEHGRGISDGDANVISQLQNEPRRQTLVCGSDSTTLEEIHSGPVFSSSVEKIGESY